LDEAEEASNHNPFVQNTRQAVTMADYRIDTSASLKKVHKQLDDIIALQNYPTAGQTH
jgi:hypothetical protein